MPISEACKKVIDNYYENLRNINDATDLTPAQKQEYAVKAVKGLKQPGFSDKVAEFAINSFISGIGTPLVNAYSVMAKAPLLIAERAILGAMPNTQAKLGEVIPMMAGMLQGAGESFKLIKAGFLKGMPLDQDPTADVVRKAIGGQEGATQVERVAGEVVRVPTRVGTAVDEFSKAMFRRMEMNALAYRISRSMPESKLGGKTRDDIYRELSQINLGEVSPENSPLWKARLREVGPVGADITADIEDFAKSAVFQQKLGDVGNSVLNLRKRIPLITLVMPFIKTPINIFKDAASYTPIVGVLASKQLGVDKKAAFARSVLGASMAAVVYQNVISGNITGAYPSNKAERDKMIAAGVPEFSVRIGDRWYSYSRIEPLASVLGLFADGTEILIDAFKNDDPKKMENITKDMAGAITKNLASKTFLEGLSNMMMAVVDPQRYGEEFFRSYANVLIPGAVAQIARAQDPVMRDVQGFMDGLANRIPGMRQELPVKFDALGQPRANPAYEFGILGITSSPTETTPVQDALKKYNVGLSTPGRTIRGVELKPIDYEVYSRQVGEAVNERIDNLIQAPFFEDLTDERKAFLINRFVNKARDNARDKFFRQKMASDPEFAAEVFKARRERKGLE